MNENRASIDWRFWLYWVLLSTVGYGGVFFIVLFVGSSFYVLLEFVGLPLYTPLTMVTTMALGGAMTGTWVGLMQWEAIRLKAPNANKKTWMIVNIVGMAISWAILFGILMEKLETGMEESSDYMILSLLAAGGLWGILSAAILWHTLYGQIKHAAIWFTVNGLCGIVIFVVGWIWIWIPFNVTGPKDEFSSLAPIVPLVILMISWPIAGFLYGLITGALLTWLMRESDQSEGLNEHVLVG